MCLCLCEWIGHEDLRQDERVMQLFGLVNSLLSTDAESKKRHLSIQRYPVIPLSPNSGLIGWVPHCDTVHSLIREYREEHNMQLNTEHRLMLQVSWTLFRLSIACFVAWNTSTIRCFMVTL